MRTLVIAEIGACHDGVFVRMVEAIETAAACGAGVAKLQWTSDPQRMARRRGCAEADGYAATYARYLAWPVGWHASLAAKAEDCGVEYCCTTYLPEDVTVVAPHVKRFKVASFEAMDGGFIEAHRPYVSAFKPLLVSTGMTTWEQLAWAYDWGHDDLFLLHCASAYPAPVNEINLQVLRTAFASNESYGGRDMGRRSRISIDFQGFSDHTDPVLTWTGALAVAAGAQIVEAHLRLPLTRPNNPDYAHAMTPVQFAEYIEHIRFAEMCLGDGVKRLQPSEQAMARYRVGAEGADGST